MGILHFIPARLQLEHPPSALSHFVLRCLQKSHDNIALGALLVGELTRGEPEMDSATDESAFEPVLDSDGGIEREVGLGLFEELLSIEHDLTGFWESMSAVRVKTIATPSH